MPRSNPISIAGNIGSGKSSVARRLAEITGWQMMATGAIFRELAARRGLTVLELNQQAETDRSIDDEVDDHLRRLAASGEPAVIDSRMAWHFVPGSFKVYLVVDPTVAVARVYGAVRDDERYASVDAATEDIIARQLVEAERYHDLYGVDVDDWRNYDLVVDTSRVTVEEAADLVMAGHTDGDGTVCHLDPARLVASTSDDDADEVGVAVANDTVVVVSGHRAVRAARDRGDRLIRAVLVAFGPDEMAAMPAEVRRAIEQPGDGA